MYPLNKIFLKVSTYKLKCALCKSHLKNSPIFMQYTGDSVCASCHNPATMPSIRNRLYEEMMKGALFPCQYVLKGCTARVCFNNTSPHETVCIFKDACKCPIERCVWVDSPKNLFTHFSNCHKASVLEAQKFQFYKKDEVFKLLQVENRNFLMWVDAVTQTILMEVINLDEGASVEYMVSLYRPSAKDEGEIRKKGYTRTLNIYEEQVIEYDKRAITEMLGKSEQLECSIVFSD